MHLTACAVWCSTERRLSQVLRQRLFQLAPAAPVVGPHSHGLCGCHKSSLIDFHSLAFASSRRARPLRHVSCLHTWP